jgi:tetratricopeptide (TPR) repeat protein
MKMSTNYFLIFPLSIILMLLLSCSTGYNKYADQYYDEGMLFYGRMEYDRSVDSFTKVLEVAPHGKDNHKVYYNRGMAYFKNRQYDKAIYDFTKALEIAPEQDKNIKFTILAYRGNAFQKNNEFDSAIKDYSEAIQLIPKHKNIKYIYHNRAWTWFNKGNYDRANEDFSNALSIDPNFDASYYGRASVWSKKADFQRALIDAKEAVKLKPANREYDNLLYEIKSSMNKK